MEERQLVEQVLAFKDQCNSASTEAQQRACLATLGQLKVLFVKSIPGFLKGSAVETSSEHTLLVRDTLEYGVMVAVRLRDFEVFDRNVTQLKTYYTDYRHCIPDSEKELMILGLNLLRQLVHHRTAAFHTELELIPLELHQSVWIQHPIRLEQYLMEGSYSKVWEAREDVPDPLYTVLVGELMNAVREEFAECAERSYERLPVEDARKLLLFDSVSQVDSFALQRGWTMENGGFVFNSGEDSKDIKPHDVIRETLGYAKELERII